MRLSPLASALLLSGCCFYLVDNSSVGGDGGRLPASGLDSDAGPLVIASCRATPVATTVGSPVNFDSTGSAGSPTAPAVVGWFWDFGDGNDGGGSVTSHAYGAAGSYSPTLTVVDSAGERAEGSCATVSVHR